MVKPKLAVYWASSCGGCEVALVNIHEKLLEVADTFDFFFCPCLLDTKKKDLESLPTGGIAVTLFNGAIRTAENREMALLLREKSSIMVAFGACAASGGIPALSNLTSAAAHFDAIYRENPALDNPGMTTPAGMTILPEGTLRLPVFYDKVKSLDDIVLIDYVVPGCPPEPARIGEVLDAIASGNLPPRGSVLGAGNRTVCDECARPKAEKRISRFLRTWEAEPDKDRCLLESGLVCMGIATRDGCGALCPIVGIPCAGCYGAPAGVPDQGAKMVAALGSIIDTGGCKGLSDAEAAARMEFIIASLPDQAGSYYKFTLAASLLGRLIQARGESK